jgi:hypothetical protein
LLTGEPGVGKTCVLRALRRRLSPDSFRLTYCHNATLGRSDFYRQLCVALGLTPSAPAAGVFYAVSTHIEELGKERVHLPSKEALHDALLSRVFEQFADALDGMASNIEDPAEVLAVSVRHALLRAEREPLWGKLLIRQSYQGDVIARGLGPRLLRDLQRGLESARFSAPDPVMMFIVVGSAILGAINAQTLRAETDSTVVGQIRAQLRELDVRTAAAVLRVLGLDHEEADAIARRPLPIVAPSGER